MIKYEIIIRDTGIGFDIRGHESTASPEINIIYVIIRLYR